MPSLDGILETCLYVGDVRRAAEFYRAVFEFEILDLDEQFCALTVADKQLLLLFKKGATLEPRAIAGGTIPPHDGDGHLHLAFAVSKANLPVWETHLQNLRIEIESRVEWARGGTSLYFRDPDGHLVELATPGIWKIY
jgi:catechol 2,3-dioxygenase-like lactoylglutathione lyase family enzyme